MDCFEVMQCLRHPQDEDAEEGVQSHLTNCPRCKAAFYQLCADHQFLFLEAKKEVLLSSFLSKFPVGTQDQPESAQLARR